MTRKQAIALLLASVHTPVLPAPPPPKEVVGLGGSNVTDSNGLVSQGTFLEMRPQHMSIRLELADENPPPKDYSDSAICFLEVHYNGKTKCITAKEIWEALA